MNDAVNHDDDELETHSASVDDLAAADEVMKLLPECPEGKREEMRQFKARLHASWGDDKFRLRQGLRPPENRFEELDFLFFNNRITEDEYTREMQRYATRPFDEVMLSEVIKEYDKRIESLTHFIEMILDVYYKRSDYRVDRLDRQVRKLCAPIKMFTTEILTCITALTEARMRQRYPHVGVKRYVATTAVELVSLVTSDVDRFWKDCKARGDDTRSDRPSIQRKSAFSWFWEKYADAIPAPQRMMTMLHQEYAIGRIALMDRPVQTAASTDVPPPPNPASAAAVSRPLPAAVEGSIVCRVPLWSMLGIGIDEHHECWAATPAPAFGSRFKKGGATKLPIKGKQWKKLIRLLASSATGNKVKVDEIAVACDCSPAPKKAGPGGQDRRRSLDRGSRDELHRTLSPVRDVVKGIIYDLGRKLRGHVDGPKGKSNPAIWIDGDFVVSGFVVRALCHDENGHLLFGTSN